MIRICVNKTTGNRSSYPLQSTIQKQPCVRIRECEEEYGVKSSGKPEEEVARKPCREEKRGGSNQQTGADCWFGKRKN